MAQSYQHPAPPRPARVSVLAAHGTFGLSQRATHWSAWPGHSHKQGVAGSVHQQPPCNCVPGWEVSQGGQSRGEGVWTREATGVERRVAHDQEGAVRGQRHPPKPTPLPGLSPPTQVHTDLCQQLVQLQV